MDQLRAPVLYFGGKQRLGAAIAAMLPPHRHYVEPFCGALGVLLAKAPSRMETVNDIDEHLMTFWRVLRDRGPELERVCALTPHARGERKQARDRGGDVDELEIARRVWVCLTQGRGGTLHSSGWRFDRSSTSTSMPRRLATYVDRLAPVARRLAGVSLESRPAASMIADYGTDARTLLYVDPPYYDPDRSRAYRREMTGERAHRDLAEQLRTCASTVVLSGAPSRMYDDLYGDWYRYELSASTTQGGQRKSRLEALWSNRPLQPGSFRFIAGPSAPARNETCGVCGAVLQQPPTGRRRQYCTGACRVRAHRASRATADLSGAWS